jgi:hypothetical protein
MYSIQIWIKFSLSLTTSKLWIIKDITIWKFIAPLLLEIIKSKCLIFVISPSNIVISKIDCWASLTFIGLKGPVSQNLKIWGAKPHWVWWTIFSEINFWRTKILSSLIFFSNWFKISLVSALRFFLYLKLWTLAKFFFENYVSNS